MGSITIGIAGLAVRIHCTSDPLLSALRERYTGFLTGRGSVDLETHVKLELGADQHLHVSPEFRVTDQSVVFDLPGYTGFIDPDRQARLRLSSPKASDGVDYFLRAAFALLTYRAGGLMLHAAGIVRRGRAYLFFGSSGSGKTTVARNSPGDLVLNDDLVILMPDSGSWRAHGTPFTNPAQSRYASESAPAAALLRLVQNPRVALEPLAGAPALAELLASVPVLNAAPAPPIDRCQAILLALPAYRLFLLPDASFWPLVEGIPIR